jgi:hypothetical protein
MKKLTILIVFAFSAFTVSAQQVIVTPVGSINADGVIRGFSTLSGGIEIVGDNFTDFCGAQGTSFIVRPDGTIDGLAGINNSYGTLIAPDNAKFYYGEGQISRNDDLIATTDGSFATALLCSNGTIAFGTWYATEINGVAGNFALYDSNGLITVFNLGGPVTGIVSRATLNEIYVTTENPGEINLHKINVETKEIVQLSVLEEEISPDNFLIAGALTRNGHPLFYGWHAFYGMIIAEFQYETGWTIVQGLGSFGYVAADPTGEYVYVSGDYLDFASETSYSGIIRSKDYASWEKFGPEVTIGLPQIFWSGTTQYLIGSAITNLQFAAVQAATLYRIDYGTEIDDASISAISVHPNPTTGVLIIETSDLNSDIKVFNSTGQLVRTFDIISFKTEIDISNLPSGLYWVNGEAILLQK